jgi:catechol 2,3-dioxygenase-like lactoylglutathione lyase family enzyme
MELPFDCVFYYASELGAAIRFYRDVLGFKLISRDLVARFDVDGVLLEIVPAAAKGSLRAPGNARLCLRVDSVEHVLQELRAKGVHAGSAVDKSTGLLGSFEDPDGNEICLWQYLKKP